MFLFFTFLFALNWKHSMSNLCVPWQCCEDPFHRTRDLFFSPFFFLPLHLSHSSLSLLYLRALYFISLALVPGSCRDAYHCPWKGWSGWSGAVPKGSCRQQSRYRDYNQHIRYLIRDNNCGGISSSCGNRQHDYRQWCKLLIESWKSR